MLPCYVLLRDPSKPVRLDVTAWRLFRTTVRANANIRCIASAHVVYHSIRIDRGLVQPHLITLFACGADFDLAAPFRLQDLGCSDTSARIGIEDRIDDVSTSRLKGSVSSRSVYEREGMEHTLCNVSIGA